MRAGIRPRHRPSAPREASDAIIERCVELLASGGIVAIKGLGGFHLSCDAANEQAVAELRRRKRRSNKPLAVMVRSLADAGRLCYIDDAERDLLAGSIRPSCCCAGGLFAGTTAILPTPSYSHRPSRATCPAWRYAPLHPASASSACSCRVARYARARHDQRQPERRAHRDR